MTAGNGTKNIWSSVLSEKKFVLSCEPWNIKINISP